MELGDLIILLQEIEDQVGPEAEVKLAFQPRWPFEHSIEKVELVEFQVMEGGELVDEPPTVYIAEGSQLGYLDSTAAKILGWS